MLDYNFYKIICGYYNIIVNNKSLNVRAKLVNDLFAKYKLIDNKLKVNNITIYMYSHLQYFECL
jgi:hypothetical protein